MAFLGNIEQFNTAAPETWNIYVQRVKFYLEANGVTDAGKKRAVFLSVCGEQTFQIARSLCIPNELADTSFDRLIDLLSTHFNPKQSEIVQRFLFNKRNQKEGETVSAWVAELRKIGGLCNYGVELERQIRDRIVCGARNEALQRRLLSEPNLTFQMAFDTATATENAASQVVELRKVPGQSEINKTEVHKESTPMKCWRCTANHDPTACRWKDADCRFCSKKGHIERACLSRRNRGNGNKANEGKRVSAAQNSSRGRSNERDHKTGQHQVKSEPPTNSDDGEDDYYYFGLHNVGRGEAPYRVLLSVNDRQCEFEIDSGASFTVMAQSCFERLFAGDTPRLNNIQLSLRDWQKKDIAILGECEVRVSFNKHSKTLPLVVTKGDNISLLGRNWFEALGIKLSMNAVATVDTNIERVLQQFSDVFDNNLGNFRGKPVKLEIDSTVRPIRLKARNVAFALRPKIEAEVEKLIRQGILEPCENPTWTTPIVPVVKSDGSIRICADYKCTLNKALQDDPYPMPTTQEIIAALNGAKVFAKLDMAQAYQQLKVDDESAKLQTIITQRGTYMVRRLCFGIKVAPQIFQRFINDRLAGENKPVPQMSSPRLVRWALFLSNYDYKLIHKPGKDISHADALSRLPADAAETEYASYERMGEVFMLENMPETPLNAERVAELTGRDPVMSRIRDFIQNGWPHNLEDGLEEEQVRPFKARRDELSTYKNCILWARKFGGSDEPRWQQEQIVRQLGPVTYETIDERGRTQKRHVDHLRRSSPETTEESDNNDSLLQEERSQEQMTRDRPEDLAVTEQLPTINQRPQRNARLPEKFRDFVMTSRKGGMSCIEHGKPGLRVRKTSSMDEEDGRL
ncbi:hypothetical protein PPYR_12880 [Photinus pyralis]|uniref:Reverse transcriptase domain-containing protein n=1 Tax=Photinus pyralis TaxID=7054 RepID=A0A5N4A7G5_PHOPY|nr:hypothetical protein PPYR_12880 [Photinus pyralis]